VSTDRLQHGQRLPHGRRPDPVRLERLAERLHGRRRQLAKLEVADARQQVAVPDLRVAVERVAREPSIGVVRPPVVLDELGEDDTTAAQLVEGTSAPGEAQVGLVVEGVVDGVELLASPLSGDRVGPPHSERPDRTPGVPARLDPTRHLRLRWAVVHRTPTSSLTRSGVGTRCRRRPPLAGTGAIGASSTTRRTVRRVERRANHSSIASRRIRNAP
jgi:hypothetical protein